MGLFKKKEPTKECQYFTATCPNCGKEYMLPFYNFQWRLDGTPNIPVAQRMESLEICECGMLVSPVAFSTYFFKTPEYQAALQTTDPTLRKLHAWRALMNSDYSLHLFYAHYHRERGDQATEQLFLAKAIDAIEQGIDNTSLHVLPSTCVVVKFKAEHFMTPQDRLVDLYRRTSQWDKALALIDKLRKAKYVVRPNAKFAILDYEEKLIHAQNSSVQ